MPRVAIMYLSDKSINTDYIIKNMQYDPWLHICGLLLVQNGLEKSEELKRPPRYGGINVISVIPRNKFVFTLPRALRVMMMNPHMLISHEMRYLLSEDFSNSFEIHNDPTQADIFANVVGNFLYSINYVDEETRGSLVSLLHQALVDAILHGNCEVSEREREEWINERKDLSNLIHLKNQDERISRRQLLVWYHVARDSMTITIHHEGGEISRFGRREHMPASQLLNYTQSENKITFTITHQTAKVNCTPLFFKAENSVNLMDKEILFKQGDDSEDLYFIVSGSIDIVADGKRLTTLTPHDVFLGEMPFLLNVRRSATAVASGDTKLLATSKRRFLQTIKNKPYYGLTISRLLAQRVTRTNLLVTRSRNA